MRTFLPTYRDKKTGGRAESAVWWIEMDHGGRRWRESSGTRDREIAEARGREKMTQLQRQAGVGDFMPDEQRKVIMGGETFLYLQKAPFVLSGFSVKGGLEWDEFEDKVKCHECGGWHRGLNVHIAREHPEIGVRAYKIKHGLNQGAALIAECTRNALIKANEPSDEKLERLREQLRNGRATMSQTGFRGNHSGLRMEYRNRQGRCPEQILRDISDLADKLGRTPSRSELLGIGLHANSIRALFGQSLQEIYVGLKLEPRPRLSGGQPAKFNQSVLIELLRDFYVRFKRLPSMSDWRRGILPSQGTYIRYFGTMAQAYYAAGLELVAAQIKRGRPRIHQLA